MLVAPDFAEAFTSARPSAGGVLLAAAMVCNRPDGEVTCRKKAAQDRLVPKQGALSFEDGLREMKPKFPAGRGACGDGRRHARARSRGGAGEPGEIARHFAQGKAIEKRVGLAVAALARLGLSAADGGKKVSLRGGA